jgi:hypothetical protein
MLGLVLGIMTLMGVTNHMGWELFPARLVNGRAGNWLITASHHELHHQKYRCNYGLYFRHWDRLCGTDRGLGEFAPARAAKPRRPQLKVSEGLRDATDGRLIRLCKLMTQIIDSNDRWWTVTRGSSPIVASAIHDGTGLRPEVAAAMALGDSDRLREEDPFTGQVVSGVDNHIIVHRSRFEFDLNRGVDGAIYETPEQSWGLQVWNGQPDRADFRTVAGDPRCILPHARRLSRRDCA